jgi:ectoine hydroxylase-related dioxygenase (phytanoyl-CoA dioxygenase family)
MPTTKKISGWHCDADVTGRLDQINVWVPLMDTFESNTLWVESDYQKFDYRPISLKYGEALLFDGGKLMHGSVFNNTQKTRVSFDFRFAPLSKNFSDPSLGILSQRSPWA